MAYESEDYVCTSDRLVQVAIAAGYKFVDNVVDPNEYPKELHVHQPVKFFLARQQQHDLDLDSARNFARIGKSHLAYALREIGSRSSKGILLPGYLASRGGAQEPITPDNAGIKMYALFQLDKSD